MIEIKWGDNKNRVRILFEPLSPPKFRTDLDWRIWVARLKQNTMPKTKTHGVQGFGHGVLLRVHQISSKSVPKKFGGRYKFQIGAHQVFRFVLH